MDHNNQRKPNTQMSQQKKEDPSKSEKLEHIDNQGKEQTTLLNGYAKKEL